MSYRTPTQQEQVDSISQSVDNIDAKFAYFSTMLNQHILQAEQEASVQRQNNARQDGWIAQIDQGIIPAYCGYMNDIEEQVTSTASYVNDFEYARERLGNAIRSYSYSNYRDGHVVLHEKLHQMAYELDSRVSYLHSVEGDLFDILQEVVLDEPAFDALQGSKRSDTIYFSYDPDDDIPTYLNPEPVEPTGCTYLDEWKSYSASYAQQYGGANGYGGTSRFVTSDRFAPIDILIEDSYSMFPLAYWPEHQKHPNN